jgi:hypothetical protein
LATIDVLSNYDMNENGIHNLADGTADQDAATYKQVKAVIASMLKKVTATIGDGTSTAFSITHNLNTQDISVQIRETTAPYNFVTATIQATDVNAVTITFSSIPTNGQYKVIILG